MRGGNSRRVPCLCSLFFSFALVCLSSLSKRPFLRCECLGLGCSPHAASSFIHQLRADLPETSTERYAHSPPSHFFIFMLTSSRPPLRRACVARALSRDHGASAYSSHLGGPIGPQRWGLPEATRRYRHPRRLCLRHSLVLHSPLAAPWRRHGREKKEFGAKKCCHLR